MPKPFSAIKRHVMGTRTASPALPPELPPRPDPYLRRLPPLPGPDKRRPGESPPLQRANQLALTAAERAAFTNIHVPMQVLTKRETQSDGWVYQSVEMAKNIEAFLWRVFNDRSIMSGDASFGHRMAEEADTGRNVLVPQGSDIAQKIYMLYSMGGMNNPNHTPNEYAVNKKVIMDVWKAVKNDRVLREDVALQNTRYKGRPVHLYSLYKSVRAHEIPRHYFEDFIYFAINDSPRNIVTHRLYLNVKLECIAEVVKLIKNYLNQKEFRGDPDSHGIRSFKLAGPEVMKDRADTVVCYCKDMAAARRLATKLVTSKEYFYNAVPGMTIKFAKGIAFGAEPERQATGFGRYNKRSRRNERIGYHQLESSQSFGSIRSQLIAMAIMDFNENQHIFGSSFFTFKQFVALAFQAHGLDFRDSRENRDSGENAE